MLKTVMVGAGGYAANYVRRILAMPEDFSLVAVVDPYATTSDQYEKFKHLPIYNQLEEFFAEHKADLAVISTPIHRHYEQCMVALENGAHVLCEKPLVPTLPQLDQLADKVHSTNLSLAVGFQLSFASDMLRIKERILSGEFGKPLCMKAIVSWHKDWAYYSRTSSWAGRRTSKDGKLVNDSVASNATAHYIHNMLFLLGATIGEAATLENLEAECYRANKIETFDTITLRGNANGADIFYTATHAAIGAIQPLMEYKFERAVIEIDLAKAGNTCTIRHNDGRVESLPINIEDGEWNKLKFTAKNIAGAGPQVCNAQTVRPVTAVLDYVFANTPFQPFKEDFVTVDMENKYVYVKDLDIHLMEGHKKRKLPSEMGFLWI